MVLALLLIALPPRAQQAKDEKDASLRADFLSSQLEYPPKTIFFRAFKKEGEFEVWVPKGKSYALFRSYKICAASGELGPKRAEGDEQVPEGFYEISGFNPTSSYWLAMRVSYPNASDRALSKAKSLGGDIMVHGNCVTMGCIPLTDDKIKEVYWLASQAKGPIPIHIFPKRLDAEQADPFWANLREGYVAFEKSRVVPKVSVKRDGTYEFR